MKIGILGAMPEEINSIKELMLIEKETTIAGKIYYEGVIQNIPVVLTFSRWGKVASASTATSLINLFQVDFILMTGVAGAVDASLNIGDIVVAHGLYQHDLDARPFFQQYQVPLTSDLIFYPQVPDINAACVAAEEFISNISSYFNPAMLELFCINQPKVHIGLVASGDKFIADTASAEDLKFSDNKMQTLAVEMEGAAVAQVCSDYQLPFIIIRVISDRADHSAIIDFRLFIKSIASQYSLGIVKNYIAAIHKQY